MISLTDNSDLCMWAEAQEHVLEKCNLSIAKPHKIYKTNLVFKCNNSLYSSMQFG